MSKRWPGGWSSKVNRYLLAPEYQKAEPVNERTMEVIESYCSVFGCGRKLSLIETLLGSRCIEHQKIKEMKWSRNF